MDKFRVIFLVSCLAVIVVLYFLSLQLDSPLLVFSGASFTHGPQLLTFSQNKSFLSAYVNSRLRYNHNEIPKQTSGRHEILWWNEPHWMKNEKWNPHCNMTLCEYSNCVVTFNKTRVKQSSVVIISIVDGGSSDVPMSNRSASQPWVFYTLESPASFQHSVRKRWSQVFNWSMTYHRDADIFTPYGRLEDRTPPSKDYSTIFRKKTKQAAWIVSHCHTTGLRETYVQKLQKYINVDIFGSCGKNPIDDVSFEKLLSEYKFYIGFENALCRDYVTEKYFHYILYDIVVIVRGSVDYNNLLPNRTFINTADFKSIEYLGNYLRQLSDDETEYVRYLKEKDKYLVYERERMYCDGLCNICEKVNNSTESRKIYNTITEWTGTCDSPLDIH